MISFKILLTVLFGLLVAGIIFLAAISYKNSQVSSDRAVWVLHTHSVIESVGEIASTYQRIQLESNAFFASGDSGLLRYYDEAKSTAIEQLAGLRNLTADNPTLKKQIDSLESEIIRLIRFTDPTISSVTVKPIPKNIATRLQGNTRIRLRIQKVIDEIITAENKLLLLREKDYDASIISFRNTFFLFAIATAILLVGTFFVVRHNFNRRTQIEEELKDANELFSKLFHESPVGVVISNLEDGVIVDCNDVYENLINYPREEIIGKTNVSLGVLTEDQRKEKIRLIQNNELVNDFELEFKPRHRDPVWVSMSMHSIRIKNKLYLLSAMLDITSHRQAVKSMTDALAREKDLNNMKSNFVTLVSHEFRTPLAAIMSSATLVEAFAGVENQQKVSKHISRIKSSVNNLTAILNDFLSVTRIEDDKVEINLATINLREQIEVLCSKFRPQAKEGQIILYQHTGSDEIVADYSLLNEIIGTLIENAIKFSPEHAPIEISSMVNSEISIKVKDIGIGIPPSDQEHLFEPFYRSQNAGNIQGTGLGLYIAKNYVEKLNGSIEVASESGKGTEFIVVFKNT